MESGTSYHENSGSKKNTVTTAKAKIDQVQKGVDLFKDLHAGEHGKVHEKIKSGEVDGLIDSLKNFTEHPKTQSALDKFLGKVDQWSPMVKLRGWWDRQPLKTQDRVRLIAKGPLGLTGTAGPFEGLFKLGLLDYHGHKDKDGNIDDSKVRSMSNWEQKKLKWTVKLGKYFVPELKAVEPLVEPLLKVASITDDMWERARQNLRANRQTQNPPEVNIAEVSEPIQSKIRKTISKAAKLN